jgi:hypothetical protein
MCCIYFESATNNCNLSVVYWLTLCTDTHRFIPFMETPSLFASVIIHVISFSDRLRRCQACRYSTNNSSYAIAQLQSLHNDGLTIQRQVYFTVGRTPVPLFCKYQISKSRS